MNHFISLFFWRELIRESGSLERLLLLTAHNLKWQLWWRRNSLHKRHSLLTQLTQSICCCWHSMKGIFTCNDYIISNWWTDSNHLRPTPQNVWAWAIALNILICKKLVTRTTMLVKVWSLAVSINIKLTWKMILFKAAAAFCFCAGWRAKWRNDVIVTLSNLCTVNSLDTCHSF